MVQPEFPAHPWRRVAWRLWLARAAWLIALFLALNLIVANLPLQRQLIRNEWLVGEAWPFASTLFGRFEAFVGWIMLCRALASMTFFATAGLLVARRRESWVVLLISADFLLLGALQAVSFNLDLVRFPAYLARRLPHLNGVMTLLIVMAILSLFYLFPDGRVRPRWLRRLAAISAANAWLWALVFAFPDIRTLFGALAPVLIRPNSDSAWIAFTGSLIAAIAVGALGQLLRYRRYASATEKQQTKWVVVGLAAFLLWPLVTFLLLDLAEARRLPVHFFVSLHLELFAMTLIPVTVALSILRYRLWEADLWLNRTLVYGTLSAIVVAGYVIVVGGLGQLLRGDNAWLAVVTTGVVALAAIPLRDRLQKQVNRLLYGVQDDPVRLLTQLGAQLEATVEADALLPTVVHTTAAALKLPYVAVRLDGADTVVAAGRPTEPLETWRLLYQGRPIGRLEVARRAPGEPLTARDRRLLTTIAQQAGAAAHAVRLTADLRRSRYRLVVAREEERRRIRRDLHDGLGPQLATLTLQLDALGNTLHSARDPAALRAVVLPRLEEVKRGVRDAIGEIRRVVHDLRPPSLDQLGLDGALRQFAAELRVEGLTIEVAVSRPLPALLAAPEVAAYRIAVEALTNVARHAGARRCTVCLWVADEALQVRVADDGRGLPAGGGDGVGMHAMRERAAELNGTLSVESGAGVTVTARLPLAPEIGGKSDEL